MHSDTNQNFQLKISKMQLKMNLSSEIKKISLSNEALPMKSPNFCIEIFKFLTDCASPGSGRPRGVRLGC